MRRVALALIPFLLASAVAAQQSAPLTTEDYARAERFLPANVSSLVTGTAGTPRWLPDGRVWYRATRQDGAAEFVMIDPARRTRAAAFDHTRLAAALGRATDTQIQPLRLPFQTFELSSDGSAITVNAAGGRWTCTIQVYECRRSDAPQPGSARVAAPPNSVTSPDGRYAAYILAFNLWVKDLSNDRERALTSDGILDFGYATNNAGWTKSDAPVLLWSPDSKKIATFQHDGRGVSDMYLVRTTAGAPRLETWKYPLPQDAEIFRIQRVVIDVESARVIRLQMPPDQHRSTISDHIAAGSRFLDVEWYPDSSRIAFVSSSRDHKQAVLRIGHATTGEVNTVLEETSKTQFQSGLNDVGRSNWRVLPATREVLWWSQRSDWGHLYLYDLETGALKRQITSGDWNVVDVVRVDDKARTAYVMGVGREAGRDPYYQHLYRVRLDGGDPQLLTAEDANHTVTLSQDAQYFVDMYSTPTTPALSVLRRIDGEVALELERADISRLSAAGWRPPTRIVVKARDGRTELHGLMFTPATLDPSRKYPIVNHVYPGPWGGSVGTRHFGLAARGDNQALAELGFVVVVIDGMGTEWRSKSFADASYGNLADNTLPDQIAGMRELAARYPYIDLERVGIWGHSGGGFAAASAMFRYPEFFKVGVAQAGNHDNRVYEDDWGERFQGLLRREGGGDNYERQANQLSAANLRGRLLLVHGAMDDNVPPYNTYLVVDALVKANKDFDLIILPEQRHGFGGDNDYVMRRRWDFFVRHLLGAEPPHEYQVGRGRTER